MTFFSSVADPGCLSRIPFPDFCPSWIPDPKTGTKKKGEKKFVVLPFFLATNITKLKIILVLNRRRKNFRKNPIPDLGSRGQKNTGSHPVPVICC
jgi:hypothetical protein